MGSPDVGASAFGLASKNLSRLPLRILATTSSADHEISSILCDPKVKYFVHDPPPVPNPNQINPLHAPIFSRIHFNIILTSMHSDSLRGSNPGGGEIFRTRPDRPWDPPSLLYNLYRVSFPGVKWPRRGVTHPPPSSAEVKERVEPYFYSPFGTSPPITSHRCLRLPDGLLPSGFTTRRLYSNCFLSHTCHMPHPSHPP